MNYSTIAFAGVSPHLFINPQLHSQGLEETLGVCKLLPLELHFTLQPRNIPKK